MTNKNQQTSNTKQNILHPATSITHLLEHGSRIIERGKGVHIYDNLGNELIDGIAGLWCVNVGYGREELAQAMAEGASELGYYHTFGAMSNHHQIELSQTLIDMTPAKLTKVFFGSSGSDANDTLVKIIWHYNNLKGRTKKKKIISRLNAYHGTSISAASLTGLKSFHTAFDLPIKNILHTECPHFYRYHTKGESEEDFVARLAKKLEDMILAEGPDTVAAFIAEPIMGAGGVINPPKGYFKAIKAVLKKYDILLIADEVICGFGRLGVGFGSDLYDIEPDMMATAKGLTSGYFPMSASFISDEIWQVLKYGSQTLGGFSHGYTYSGHPIGARVANVNLGIIKQDKLIENAASTGAYLQAQLNERFAQNLHIGEVRGHGLLAAIQLMANKENKTFFDPALKLPARILEACYERGLVVRALPSVTSVALSPPLIINQAQVDDIIDRLEDGVNAVIATLSADELKGI
jgi:L-2,4-diaminobutyrate transaminase